MKLRKKILGIRIKQDVKEKAEKDKKILKKLRRMKLFINSDEFLTYITHKGEVSTDELINEFCKNKKIIVPKTKNGRICLYELKKPHEYKNGKYGIREPVNCLPLGELDSVEIAFIPGIVFDLCGHRIGYGGGYFDRLLSKLRCTTIGLAYEFQIVDKVPARSYDVAVDYVVTEKRVIDCKKYS